MSAVDVSVIVVTYNSVRFIDACVAGVKRAAAGCDIELIVVDNASIDGTADHVRVSSPDVLVIDTGWNSGFSRACNVGAAVARGRYVLLLNGDAELAPLAIDRLVDVADRIGGPRVAAPKVCNADGSDQGTARAFPTPSAAVFGRRSPLSRTFPNNRFTARYMTGRDRSGREPFEVDWVSGACLLIDRPTWDLLGGLDESFFMYWEDADLCRRVKSIGGRVWCVPAVTATHDEGSSAAVTTPRQNRRFHTSAYRYASKHLLRGPYAVARPLAAGALLARAVGVRATHRVRPTPNVSAATHPGEEAKT